jgi:hypothetical protein
VRAGGLGLAGNWKEAREMAGATRSVKRQWGLSGPDAMLALVEEFNKVVDDLETLRAELVAESTSSMAASALVAGKLETTEAGDP